MLRKKLPVTVTFFAMLGLLVSCTPGSEPTPSPKPVATATGAPTTAAASIPKPSALSPTPKPAGEQPRYGGILTVGIGGDPSSLDVHREETYTLAIAAGVYSGLAKYDPLAWPEAKVVPDLATSWELSPDGRVYTFHLVQGAKFHDGTPVTAEDAKFSFDRIRDPQAGLTRSPRRQQLGNVTSIEAPDDSTVKITLGYPQASFVPTVAIFLFGVMPKHVVLENKNDMTKTMVGTGAFKFTDYTSGVSWELVKNPDYFVKGRPYLDGVKAYIIRDSFARFAALRTGNVRWWAPLSPYMTVSQAKIIEETLSDKITVKWAFHPAWYGLIFNVTNSILHSR